MSGLCITFSVQFNWFPGGFGILSYGSCILFFIEISQMVGSGLLRLV